jgi:DNA-binding MarR family transcriptional regulator
MRSPTDADLTLPQILRETMATLIRHESADLTARQFAVFLVCYVEDGPHTVRGLAERARLSKPAVSRVLDRLGELGLARRVDDPGDRRSMLVARTPGGFAFLRMLRATLEQAAATVRTGRPGPGGPLIAGNDG